MKFWRPGRKGGEQKKNSAHPRGKTNVLTKTRGKHHDKARKVERDQLRPELIKKKKKDGK